VGGQNGVDYVWIFSGGGTQNSSNDTAKTRYNFQEDGTYNVTMRARVRNTGCECSKTIPVVMNRGNAKDLEVSGVTVYPNPTAGQINIAMTAGFGKQVEISLHTVTGNLVQQVKAENNGMITLNGTELSNGVYLVRIASGDKVVTRKVNIQH
ncbi:MAG: T9SS type A sorting domain-containing protein, partial [Bacteroidetes bacterium]|nr:T9SS type A sorting domain-containing protein [Bacteroidota bacterium]